MKIFLCCFFLLIGFCVAQPTTPVTLTKEFPNDPVCLIKTSLGDIYVELFVEEAPETVKNFIGLAEGQKEYTNQQGQKAKGNFYDGLIFHRVIADFMIQGGCPKGDGTGDPGYEFTDEINAKLLGLNEMKVQQQGRTHSFLGIRSRQQFEVMVLVPLCKKLGITNNEQYQRRHQEVAAALENLTIQQCYENMGYKYQENLKSHFPKRGVIAMANSGPNTNGSQFFINVIDTDWLTGKHTVFGKVIAGMDVVDQISKVSVGPMAKPVQDVKIVSIRLVQEPEK